MSLARDTLAKVAKSSDDKDDQPTRLGTAARHAAGFGAVGAVAGAAGVAGTRKALGLLGDNSPEAVEGFLHKSYGTTSKRKAMRIQGMRSARNLAIVGGVIGALRHKDQPKEAAMPAVPKTKKGRARAALLASLLPASGVTAQVSDTLVKLPPKDYAAAYLKAGKSPNPMQVFQTEAKREGKAISKRITGK